jgi:large subunit ribosomal protein L32
MAVPKRKQSRSRRDSRSANKGLTPQPANLCFEGICQGTPKLPHLVCEKCGFYKGRKILTTKAERDLKRDQARKAREAARPAKQQDQDDSTQS